VLTFLSGTCFLQEEQGRHQDPAIVQVLQGTSSLFFFFFVFFFLRLCST